jgi:hypothetical protein
MDTSHRQVCILAAIQRRDSHQVGHSRFLLFARKFMTIYGLLTLIMTPVKRPFETLPKSALGVVKLVYLAAPDDGDSRASTAEFDDWLGAPGTVLLHSTHGSSRCRGSVMQFHSARPGPCGRNRVNEWVP